MRLIFSTGDKGGVGKSVVARMIADYFCEQKYPVNMYDCDKRNSLLQRFYDPINSVRRVNLLESNEADKWIDEVVESGQDALIDLPAGGNEFLEKMDEELHLFELFAEQEIDVTLVSVINRSKDSINALKRLIELAGNMADYVVVKNGYYGKEADFERFDNSKTRVKFLDLGGKVIYFPSLADAVFDQIEAKNLAFYQCVGADSPLTISARRRVHYFRQAAITAFESLGDRLCVSTKDVEVAA